MSDDDLTKLLKIRGIKRLYYATLFSLKGLYEAIKEEPSFQYQLVAYAFLFPLIFFIGKDTQDYIILASTITLILIIEIVNTAIERIVDLVSPEKNHLAGKAKDLGSAAVFLCMMLALAVWGTLLWINILADYF